MTTTELHRTSFDTDPKTAADWVKTVAGQLNGNEVWLLLEQTWCWDFKGPDHAECVASITEESVGKYGLRGRLFWEQGQVEWRRWEDGKVRVVALHEGSGIAPPAGFLAQPAEQDHVDVSHDSEPDRLLLWGETGDAPGFCELRVSGPNPIPYPKRFEELANGPGYRPVLYARRYFDRDENEVGWRLTGAGVVPEGGKR